MIDHELSRRVDELAEGQSRFMDGIFAQVNESNARIRGLEQRVQWLEMALRGLLDGGRTYETRTWDESNPNV